MFRLCGTLVSLFLFLLLVAAGGVAFLFGTETGETFVRSQTTAALGRLLGPSYEASLGDQHFEMRADGMLALNWTDVVLQRRDRPDQRTNVDQVSVAVRLMPLVNGRLEFGRLEMRGARIDLAAFSEDGSVRRRDVAAGSTEHGTQPAAVPARSGSVIARTADSAIRTIERQLQALQAYHFDTVSFSDITIEGLPTRFGSSPELVLRYADLHRTLDGSLQLSSSLRLGPVPVSLSGAAEFDGETSQLVGFSLRSGRIDLASVLPPTPRTATLDERPFGSDAALVFEAGMQRDGEAGSPILHASLHSDAGHVQLGLNHTRVEAADLRIEYREGDDQLRLLPSPVRFDGVAFDLEGSLAPEAENGVADPDRLRFRLGSDEIRSQVGLPTEDDTARTASLWLDGRIDPAARFAELTALALKTANGSLVGRAAYRAQLPQDVTSLDVQASDLAAADVKAFWPFFISGKSRTWVLAHLGDVGSVPTGTIALSVSRDRLGTAFKPTEYASEDELRMDIGLAGLDIDTVGTVPRLHQTNGRLESRGTVTKVFLDEATLAGQPEVKIGPAVVTMAKPRDGNIRDLLLDLDVATAGSAAGVLAVADAEPIRALRNLALDPALATGSIDGHATASLRLGEKILPADQMLGWSVTAKLAKVDPGQPIQGRRFADLDGEIAIVPGKVSGSLKGTMDGIAADMSLAVPFGGQPVGERKIEVTLDVPARKAAELVPALADVVDGPIAARITDAGDGLKAELQLTRTALKVPAMAWTKGAGVAASLSFAIRTSDEGTELDDIVLSGDGFSARGSAKLDKSGLRTAVLRDVALNPGDDVDVSVERHGKGFGITIDGAQFDARPILSELKATVGQDKNGRVGGGTFDITADIARLNGFGGKSIADFTLNFASSQGRMAALNLGGRTGGGAVSGDLSPRGDQRAITIAAADAGAFLNFSGVYGHMEGGQARLELIGSADDGYRGRLQMQNFTLVDEPRLSRIVGSSPKPGSASLSQALGQELRTERAFFDQASANLTYGGATLRVADGIVRGPVFGSSFSGTLYDPKSRIDIAGSFMPAYGINRVFGAIPILGQILGNGNEGGLIGITYHLSGPFASPTLVVNPISAIAPGIFRQIFSYE